MAKIKLIRKPEWNNRKRFFTIFLDEKEIGKIGHKEEIELEIEKGKHNLLLKVDWLSSKKISFSLTDNETKTFIISAFKYANVVIISAATLLLFYILIKIIFDIQLIHLLILSMTQFLYPLYYNIFGRKNYIRIKEVT